MFHILTIGSVFGFFWIFMKYYTSVLDWVLRHKVLFLSLPVLVIMIGMISWRGFDTSFKYLANGFNSVGINIEETALWTAIDERFPGLGQEFMPTLDEGSFLLMPTAMPHAGVEEGEEVVFHGAFRIDSEMQLADRFSMMNREPGSGAVPIHDHGGMDMDYDMDMNQDEMESSMNMDINSIDVENHSDHVPDNFIKYLTELVKNYVSIKDALLESDFEQAVDQAGNAKSQLESIGQHRLSGDAHDAWNKTYNALDIQITAVIEANDISQCAPNLGNCQASWWNPLNHLK